MENKIVQLKDERGNNIYPLGYISSSLELLWTNASPTASFSAQTVSLDLSEYNLVFITANKSTAATAEKTNCLCEVGGDAQIQIVGGTLARRVARVRSNGVEFGQGLSGDSGSNTSMIPTKIYGIR